MDCKLRAKNCGGCPMLGMDYAAQLKQKEETVKKLLGRFGPVEHIRGMETPYHYRNKVISTFTTGWGGKLTSGIYAANSHKVLPVESCLLQDEVLDKTMLAVRAAAGICHYQPFNEDKGTGLLRHCLLRRGVMTGQVMVVLVTAQPVLPGARNFVKALLTEAGKQGVAITTIVQNVNDRKTSVVLGDMEKVLYGKGFILDTLCGKTYAISPRSFYQINHTQTEVLYGLAVDAAHLTGKEVVLDAYCGIGTIGLTAADHAKQVVGVEVNREAVHDAIGNAKHNGVKNARFKQPVRPGDVLVVPYTTNELLPYIRQAAAVITEEASAECHTATIGLALDKPVIVGAAGAVQRLTDGTMVTVDCARGLVRAMP